ncbi:MAG TPA: monovalent cation:proton antiporter-2 (CPA2) family protein [Nevskiaceae bacterium]|nr:monovalent cation:proton antiporter-2 (CPA2) family protein [Nevskiaceae bacterium]
MLTSLTLYLAAAVVFVPLFKRFGLGAVLGYLAAGIVIGPHGLTLIDDVDAVMHVSELGVVLLLFVIGLELQPQRLWVLRHSVFGMGGAQVGLTTLALCGIALALGLPPAAAVVAGFGLAMSSTALVLQMLGERKELPDRHGRAAFAILLFQDLSVIPFLALVPLLAPATGEAGGGTDVWFVLRGIAVVIGVVVGGRYVLRPILRVLAAADSPEVFTAAALLVVVGTGLLMSSVGLSMSLGAFLAGVLLADSEYRHELQADIEPFKGLLLGLFFIAVGMSADLDLVLGSPLVVLGLVVGLVAVKAAVLYGVGRATRLSHDSATRLAVAASQGGEFAFVLFGVAATSNILDPRIGALLIVTVTASMILTPPLYAWLSRMAPTTDAPAFDEIVVDPTPVVMVGFGPFGQIIGRILRLRKIPYTVLERDHEQVAFLRQFGNPVFYSDASRVEVLRAAHVDKAQLLVITVADPEDVSLHIARAARRHFPHVRIFAVARTRQHAMHLTDIGVHRVIRRAFYSSLEMTRHVLAEMGDHEDRIRTTIERFKRFDAQSLARQQAIFRDETKMMQSAQEAARELEQLFESDESALSKDEPLPPWSP